ncbi:hypothetical protein [Roseimicrobium sp. ORNL1]|uniref:hypothetical protein n=1 Tax=Roseimicrobium sp. ORNL1 TaxID=2711231 RepID=UPI0013E1DE8D|nr:hypothetical protein [Roseimicrobium sp. ORNL1]QIF04085.1 hypothetical protein G5S37_21995 [Roseimicrobium sp. ORNL1]
MAHRALCHRLHRCSSPDETKVFFFAQSDEDGNKTFRLLDVKTGKIRVLGEAPES